MLFLAALMQDIEDAGIATAGADFYAGSYPVGAGDKCSVIRQSPGPEQSKDLPVEEHLIQFLSRAPDYRDAYAVVRAVYERYHGKPVAGSWDAKHNYLIGGYYVQTSKALQQPGDIGPDEKDRAEVSLNLLFKVRL